MARRRPPRAKRYRQASFGPTKVRYKRRYGQVYKVETKKLKLGARRRVAGHALDYVGTGGTYRLNHAFRAKNAPKGRGWSVNSGSGNAIRVTAVKPRHVKKPLTAKQRNQRRQAARAPRRRR